MSGIQEEDIDFIERHLFSQFDEAYRKYVQDDYPNYDEVLAYERALRTMALVRERVCDDSREETLRHTARVTCDALDLDTPQTRQ